MMEWQELLAEMMVEHRDTDSAAYNHCDSEPCEWCGDAAKALAFAQPAQAAQEDATRRTPKDYAIEHAGYLASAADRYIDAVFDADLAREIYIETGDLGDSYALNEADELLSEYQRTLSEHIHEFRKRRDRAMQAAPEGEK